jgi:hypothetical protein
MTAPTTAWTTDELDRVGHAEQLHITTARPDGSPRPWVPIWVVRVGDDLYVRSWRGDDGAWYRAAKARREGRISAGGVDKEVTFVDARAEIADAVDAAYREKYARYPSYVPPMLSDQARATTLELVPHDRANTP